VLIILCVMPGISSSVNSSVLYIDDIDSLCKCECHLYSASSQKAPLMRSMCRVLVRKTCLQCTTKTVNLHVRLTQIVLEQVPCRWSSDSEGATATAVHRPIELKLWNNE